MLNSNYPIINVAGQNYSISVHLPAASISILVIYANPDVPAFNICEVTKHQQLEVPLDTDPLLYSSKKFPYLSPLGALRGRRCLLSIEITLQYAQHVYTYLEHMQPPTTH